MSGWHTQDGCCTACEAVVEKGSPCCRTDLCGACNAVIPKGEARIGWYSARLLCRACYYGELEEAAIVRAETRAP